MKKIVSWIKKVLGVEKLERQRVEAFSRLDKLEELSMIGADIGINEKSYLILTTRMKGGIVKVIEIEPDKYSISQLLQEVEFMAKKYGIVS